MKKLQPEDQGMWLGRFGPVEAAVGLTLALLLYHASVYAFLTDDAFISFRYARNLSQGYGLVFNPGFERVEGYTNFLWVVVLAGLNLMGLSPESVANVLSVAATVVLWGLVVWFVYRAPPPSGRRWLLLSAPLFLAATRSVAVWSTSGLETRLFEVLVVGGALRLVVEVESRLAGRPRREVAVFLFALATLTRPDGLLISLAALAAAGMQLAIRRCLDLRRCAAQIGWYALIVGAHFAFRLIYYGQWLPNTYYAKVGGRTWWDMGFVYLGLFALEYAVYLWVPLLVAAWFEHRNHKTLFRPALFAAVVVPHALYIASIGGDHFEYRPLDLYFPFALILLYDGARRLARGRAAYLLTAAYLALVLVGLTALPYQSHRQFPGTYLAGFPGMPKAELAAHRFMRPQGHPIYSLPGWRHLAEAHRKLLFEATEHFVAVRQEEHRLFLASVVPEGHRLRRLVEAGLLPGDTYLAIACVGAIPYYSDLRVLDRLGLTDVQVARSESRGGERAMAHDKKATRDYARRVGVDLWSYDKAHSLLHVTDPLWLRYLLKITDQQLPVYAAHVGEGYYLLGFLPRGIEAAARRFPKLHFRPLAEPAVAWSVLQQAIESYRQELRDDPNDNDTRMALADVLLFTRKGAAALELYQAVLAARPEDSGLWRKLCLAHLEVGDAARALAAARRAFELAQEQDDQVMIDTLRTDLARCRSLLPSARQP